MGKLNTARTLLARFAADFERTAPAAVATLERGFDDATAVLALPLHYLSPSVAHHQWRRVPRALQICRRERVIRIFPNRESAVPLLGARRGLDDRAPVLRYDQLLAVA
jgi:hypothetical protein